MAPSGGPNDGEGGGARDAVNGRVPDEDEPDHDEHAPEGRHPDGQPGDGHRARRTQPVRIQTGTAVPLSRADSATSLASSASSQVSGISPSPIDKWHRALLSALSPSAHTDPFEGLLRAGLSAETCVRYQFDAHTGSWTRKEEMAMVEPEPFARGSLRECFRAKKLSNWVGEGDWTRASNLVLKHYHSVAEEPANAELVRADVRVQMTAKLLAQHFNRLHPPKQIDMLQTFVLSFPERPGAPHFCAERFIEGPYAKYNSNVGYVGGSPTDDHVRSTPQAFSHWTFEGTFGRQMCVDVQGVDDLFTDPQLHTYPDDPETSGGEGDLGIMGYALFFRTHRCNAVCRMLGLQEFERPPPSLLSNGTGGSSASEPEFAFPPITPDSTVPRAAGTVTLAAITPRKQRFESLYRRPSLQPPTSLPRRRSLDPAADGVPRRRSAAPRPEDAAQLGSITALAHRTLARAHLVPGKLPAFSSEHAADPDGAALFHYAAAARMGDATSAWMLAAAHRPDAPSARSAELDGLDGADPLRLPHVPPAQRSDGEALRWARTAGENGSVPGCLAAADALPSPPDRLPWLERALGILADRRALLSLPEDAAGFPGFHGRRLLADLAEAESRYPYSPRCAEGAEEWDLCAAIAGCKEGEEAAEWYERAAEGCVECGMGRRAEGYYRRAEKARG